MSNVTFVAEWMNTVNTVNTGPKFELSSLINWSQIGIVLLGKMNKYHQQISKEAEFIHSLLSKRILTIT